MLISAIVAMSLNRVIGKNNQLPWHLPADLNHFKQLTLHKPIIMGRKTYESIGKALPERSNLILSSNPHFHAADCLIFPALEKALHHCKDNNIPEVMIIGGANVYIEALPLIQRVYLTLIHEKFEGDVFFPELNSGEWKEISQENYTPDNKNRYAYSFITLEKLT